MVQDVTHHVMREEEGRKTVLEGLEEGKAVAGGRLRHGGAPGTLALPTEPQESQVYSHPPFYPDSQTVVTFQVQHGPWGQVGNSSWGRLASTQ